MASDPLSSQPEAAVTDDMALRSASIASVPRSLIGSARRNSRAFSETVRRSQAGQPPLSVRGPQECALLGTSLLRSPYFNKGSAFTTQERNDFDLNGLLPPNVQSLQEQVGRAYRQFQTRSDPLAKNTFLASMKDQNEVLYYALVQAHIKEMFPIIYTPTQGDAIAKYSELFRRPAGCFLNIEDPEGIDSALSKWGSSEDVDLIVVTDGEAILGIGDQGVGGILISSAKLSVYTLCAGIHPHRVLPIVLDVGTDNDELLRDELYLGLKRKRVRGERYDSFVQQFVDAARRFYPQALLHFEDFGLKNAARLLDQYRPQFATFNDDIQGTGCTALAAVMAACKVANLRISDLRIVCFGAGSAGMGNATQIASAIALEKGCSLDDAKRHFYCIDRPGLLLQSHGDQLTPAQRSYARPDSEFPEDVPHGNLEEVIRAVKPHVLIGCSTVGGAFTEEAVREMARHTARPIILPLSNPTRLAEADPADLAVWTDGAALVATGTAFPPTTYKGVTKTTAQCNNSVIFPAIGLGTILCRARLLSDEMLVAATSTLAAHAPALQDPEAGGLLPDVTQVRELSVAIAIAVIRKAVEEGLATVPDLPSEPAELDNWVRAQMWAPEYRPLKRVDARFADRHARGEAGAQGTRPSE